MIETQVCHIINNKLDNMLRVSTRNFGTYRISEQRIVLDAQSRRSIILSHTQSMEAEECQEYH